MRFFVVVMVSTFFLPAPAAWASKKPKKPAKAAAPAHAAPANTEAAHPQATTPPASNAPAAHAPPAANPPPAAPREGSLDFDLLGPATGTSNPGTDMHDAAKAAELERAVKTRRRMLLAHQAVGFSLLGVMTANTVLGTLNYYDKFAGGGFTERYNLPHLITAISASALFATNLILGLAAPVPYEKPLRWDTARVHEIMMIAATVGMATQMVLGLISVGRLGQLNQRDFARAHLITGYVTYGLTLGGVITYLF